MDGQITKNEHGQVKCGLVGTMSGEVKQNKIRLEKNLRTGVGRKV